MIVRSKLAMVTAAAALVVAGCSSLVPPQQVGNPLGLDGASVTVTVTDGPVPAAVKVVLPAATGSGSATGSFSDIESPVSPGSFSISQPLGGTATLSTSLTEPPLSIVLSDLELTVTVSDAENATEFVMQPSGSATLELLSGNDYEVSNASFDVELTGAALAELNPILLGGGVNEVNATLSLTATSSPELPLGSTILLTFGDGQGTVGF